jgi:hypothetical protein
LAQDRGRWRAVVNTVINLWVLVPRSSMPSVPPRRNLEASGTSEVKETERNVGKKEVLWEDFFLTSAKHQHASFVFYTLTLRNWA